MGFIIHFLSSIRDLLVDGITLLHEGYHAKHWTEERYDWRDTQTFCTQEVATYEFQNRIISELGGESYRHVLEEEVKRQFDFLNVHNVQVGAGFSSRLPYDARLDENFGPALSQKDKNFRQTNLWIHANFVLLERNFKGDVEIQKSLFLKTIYTEDKILPTG